MADDDNSSEIISQKLPRLETNYELCIRCRENHSNLEVRRNPELDLYCHTTAVFEGMVIARYIQFTIDYCIRI